MDLSFMYKAYCDEAKAAFLCLAQKKKSQIRLNLRLLAEMVGFEPWHRSPGLSHFEFFLLHGTWRKIEGVSRTYQKIRTIEFTFKTSSKSKITRLHADLNPLSKTQKICLLERIRRDFTPFGENGRERFPEPESIHTICCFWR